MLSQQVPEVFGVSQKVQQHEDFNGKLCPLEIKKTVTPDKRITRAFSLIDKSPLVLGTSAVLCMADKLGAFDSNNLIVPIWMI